MPKGFLQHEMITVFVLIVTGWIKLAELRRVKAILEGIRRGELSPPLHAGFFLPSL
jgi:hypothetical protein